MYLKLVLCRTKCIACHDIVAIAEGQVMEAHFTLDVISGNQKIEFKFVEF
jgi:hypothetical protein